MIPGLGKFTRHFFLIPQTSYYYPCHVAMSQLASARMPSDHDPCLLSQKPNLAFIFISLKCIQTSDTFIGQHHFSLYQFIALSGFNDTIKREILSSPGSKPLDPKPPRPSSKKVLRCSKNPLVPKGSWPDP